MTPAPDRFPAPRFRLGSLVALLLLGWNGTGLAAEAANDAADERPNILWLTSEDNSVDWIGCYGNPHADTPHIDALAAEGHRYPYCFANAPVCAPARSTWITGMHALSMGTHNMRSRYPIPHDRIAYYPDLLKKAGYYVGNARKTDYNIGGRPDGEAWDTNKMDWKTLKKQQPFFMVLNTTKSHESKAFGDVTKTTHSPENVRVAEYHPDIPVIRQNYAHYHDQVKKMDADIGAALKQLEESGLAENTIVVYNSDHGGVIARSKRFLFDSGTHCPLIVRIPEKYKQLRPGEPGRPVEDIVSFVDMPKTWLSLCGAETPDYLQGKVFLGPDKETRDDHVSFRARMDERCDNVRAIRDRKFLYIRNYMPYAPWGQHLNYLWNMEATRAWEEHHRAGRTNEITGRFFGTKPRHELYDTEADPDNVHNLADDPKYAAEVERMSAALDEWQREIHDSGLLPESEVVRLADDAGLTIFEFVRDPQRYDVPALQAASAAALAATPADLPALTEKLSSDDLGQRYWATVGCFRVQERDAGAVDLEAIRGLLDDESHHVRTMAAWILFRAGERDAAQACWKELLREDSYASLKVLNVIDWIGEGFEPYAEAIAACDFSHGGYVDRMKEYAGVGKKKGARQ
ncbi:sulfatase-like hydrolase/transferase [Alienimonas sp. DA493]|uniref:sulfatase-like hydrolase/transferase n=1 Tax=Alienimonas sp. DA493 TaxID=3373605 RepID=UPI003754D8E7